MDSIIVRSRIREAVKGKIDNVAEEAEIALNGKVIEILDKACERARANGRKTLQARDF